jgi:hypothetical protein
MSACRFVGWSAINWSAVEAIATALAFTAVAYEIVREGFRRRAADRAERTSVVSVITGTGKVVVHNSGRFPISNLIIMRQKTDDEDDRSVVVSESGWVLIADFAFGVAGGDKSQPIGVYKVKPDHKLRTYFRDLTGQLWVRLEDGQLKRGEAVPDDHEPMLKVLRAQGIDLY